jgi:hypothetical protein
MMPKPKQSIELWLTEREQTMLCSAVRLRAEACEENEEGREAHRWRVLLVKLEAAL